MKALAVALLGFALTGCASASQHRVEVPVPPVSQWHDAAEEALPPETEAAMTQRLAAVSSVLGAPAAEPADPAAEGSAGAFEPEVVHRARIAIARAALVEDNLNKARVDLAEELQRELAAIQETGETSKSRVRHGKPRKKEP